METENFSETYYQTLKRLIKRLKTTNHLHQFHAHSLTTGLLSTSLLTTLLFSLTTTPTTPSILRYAFSIFNSIPTPSTFAYNTIIRLHTHFSSPLTALTYFSLMRRFSVPLDSHSFPFAFKACASIRDPLLSNSLHCQALKSGFVSDLYVVNSLIRVYAVCGCMDVAFTVFDGSPVRDVVSYNLLIDGFVKDGDLVKAKKVFDVMPVRDCVSWGTLISGYVNLGYCYASIRVFNEMVGLGIRPDNVALVSVLSACAQVGELEEGKRVHEYVERIGVKVDCFLSTALIDFYAKCGEIDAAVEVFNSCMDRNLFTWNAMLVGLAIHGRSNLLLSNFTRMIECGVKPDGVSLLGVLVGCSHGGLVHEARRIFDSMESVYGVHREAKHYGCMADLLGRAGLLKEAAEMIKSASLEGDVSVWTGLLGGCRIHGNIEIAEEAAKHIMELKPEDGGVYSILTNVYADADRWEDVVKTRKSLSSNRVVKKIAGYSLIQLEGVVHQFIAGDMSHSQSNEIFLVLNGLREQQSKLCLEM